MRIAPKSILCVLLILPVFASCIREDIDPCPPLRVNIAVKDKNYFNVDNVDLEERKSTNLAFREYVPTLYYVLSDANTGEIVEEYDVNDVEGDGSTVPVVFRESLPHGTYVLTVWGGLEENSPLGDDPSTIDFHPEQNEGRDIYLTKDTLVYDAYHYDYTVELERTKGKLIIQGENFPQGFEFSTKSVSNLFASTDVDFQYSGSTSVTTQSSWSGNSVVTKTVLTPSISERASIVTLNIYDPTQSDSDILAPNNARITMRRNELTVLRYVWESEKNDFAIYLLVNDNWQLLHDMGID